MNIKNVSLASTSKYLSLLCCHIRHIRYRNVDQQQVSLPTDVHDATKTAETSAAVKRVPVYTRV